MGNELTLCLTGQQEERGAHNRLVTSLSCNFTWLNLKIAMYDQVVACVTSVQDFGVTSEKAAVAGTAELAVSARFGPCPTTPRGTLAEQGWPAQATSWKRLYQMQSSHVACRDLSSPQLCHECGNPGDSCPEMSRRNYPRKEATGAEQSACSGLLFPFRGPCAHTYIPFFSKELGYCHP